MQPIDKFALLAQAIYTKATSKVTLTPQITVMPKHYSQWLMLFALLIFAAQSFASSSVVCKMVTYGSQYYASQAPHVPPADQNLPSCHSIGTSPSAQAQSHHSGATQNTADKDCFYCANKLCNTSIGSAFVASNALTPVFSRAAATKANPYTEHFSSININTPYRPPIVI